MRTTKEKESRLVFPAAISPRSSLISRCVYPGSFGVLAR